MGGGRVIEVNTKAEWDQIMADNPGKAIFVDFSATWCGPCQMIGPYFGQLSEQFPDAIFIKVDVDQNAAVAAACGISAMPTFQVFKDGQKVEELIGAQKDKLKGLIERHAKAAALA